MAAIEVAGLGQKVPVREMQKSVWNKGKRLRSIGELRVRGSNRRERDRSGRKNSCKEHGLRMKHRQRECHSL